MAAKKQMVLWLVVIPLAIVIGSRIRVYTDPFCISFNLAPGFCWNLIPQTIETRYGIIHVPAFSFYDVKERYIAGDKRLRHNLVILGNEIEREFSGISWNYNGMHMNFDEDNLQSFTLNGVNFLIEWYNEYADFQGKGKAVILSTQELDEIVLKDNTVIKPDYSPRLRLSKNEWEVYRMRYGAELTSPRFEGSKWVSNVTFEPDWGNLISYEEAKRPD
jgi:hypothetical protein